VLVESGSGSRLPAWTVAPKADGKGIDVLLLHGNGGNILTNLGAGVALMKLGFRVTLLEYSGFGWATGEADRDHLLEDAAAGLTRFSAEARAAGRPLVLYGMSLGGHLAVVTAANDPDAVDALVIEGAFSSHRDMAAHRKGALARMAVSEPYSAEKVIADFGKPLLVIHSRDDTVVPFSMGQELYDLAAEPKRLMAIDGPHLAGLAAHAEEIGAAIEGLVISGPPGDVAAPAATP
jgi:pimeloyl-ACP methyl ester carboxylesterase